MATLVSMAHKKLEQADVITWASVHNILPIMATMVTVIVAFTTLQGRVDVMNERMGHIEEQVRELKGSVKGEATVSAELVPSETPTPIPTRKPTSAATPAIGQEVGPDTL